MTTARPGRRDVLKIGAMTGAALAFGHSLPLFAQQANLPLITKPIPSTGEQLPVIGLGTNAYSVNTPEQMAPLRDILAQMSKMGGKVIDTARVYGRSEEVIGQLLSELGNRDTYFIATKTPIQGALRAPAEELHTSFDRLRVKTIELMLIHNLHGLDELMPAFLEFKKQGRIRYIGMSTSVDNQYAAQMDAMRRYPLDFIQVDYSIANRGAADAILPLAQERKMGVLINVPFGGRGRGAASTFGRVNNVPVPAWAAEFDAVTWGQVFLKYVVSHPAVTAAIPGTTQLRNMVDNQGAGRGRLPTPEQRRQIEQFWDKV
jgi:aryl-alcohol dehydrogenase-like predicted oxidoreductase